MEKMTLEMVDSTLARFNVGKIITGTVVMITKDGAIINIGGKGDAFIYNEDLDGEELQVGQSVDAIVLDKKDENGYVKLSLKKAKEIEETNRLIKGLKLDDIIEVNVKNTVNGGLVGSLAELSVFIPQSQVEFKYKNDLKFYVGKTCKAIVIDINAAKKKVVASIRALNNKIRKEQEDSFWNGIAVDKIVEGKITKFTDFGAFVDVNGKSCLIHNHEVGYFNEKASEVFKLNEVYSFIVLRCNRQDNKVSLGYKQLFEDPRIAIFDKFEVGQKIKGTVVRTTKYGAFVNVAEHIDGLLHNSEAGYDIKNIEEVCKIGDELELSIIDIDKETFKLALSLREYDVEDEY